MTSRSAYRLGPSVPGERPALRWALGVLLHAAPLCMACALLFDVPLARWADRSPVGMRRVAEVFSSLGLSGYMLAGSGLCAAACFALRRSHALGRPRRLVVGRLGEHALFVFSAVASSGLIVQVVKHVVGRARPSLMGEFGAFHFDHFSLDTDLASFPSGHSTSICALATALVLLRSRLALAAVPVAVAVGAARIILDAHYSSDILAGAVLGTITTVALAAAFAKRSIAFTLGTGHPLRVRGDRLGLVVKRVCVRALP